MHFKDRHEAGTKLAEQLKNYKNNKDVIVLAIPRGGVEVGYEIAKALNVKLDIIVTKKIGLPDDEEFAIGGSKTVRGSHHDRYTIVTAGITLFEALEASDELKKQGVFVRVIDAYSIKPLDERTLLNAARETRAIITVEDHYAAGGLGEAVASALSELRVPVHCLAVTRLPRSGAQSELLDYEGISKSAIIKAVLELEK